MDVTEIIVVSIGCFFLFALMPTIIAISSYKEKQLKLQRELATQGGDMNGQMAHALTEIERLRERVAVLEKLATDGDRKLAHEIEGLRGHARP
jgi:hypothetical protein